MRISLSVRCWRKLPSLSPALRTSGAPPPLGPGGLEKQEGQAVLHREPPSTSATVASTCGDVLPYNSVARSHLFWNHWRRKASAQPLFSSCVFGAADLKDKMRGRQRGAMQGPSYQQLTEEMAENAKPAAENQNIYGGLTVLMGAPRTVGQKKKTTHDSYF
ncbi:uncharacterized protein LOC144616011 isoform X2 [Panthera onca]